MATNTTSSTSSDITIDDIRNIQRYLENEEYNRHIRVIDINSLLYTYTYKPCIVKHNKEQTEIEEEFDSLIEEIEDI